MSLNKSELRLLYKTPTHTYIAPHPALAAYIAHYTFCFQTLSNDAALPERLTLIPDASGCIVSSFNGRHLTNCFWGPTTKTVTVYGDIDSQPLRFFVEFLPCGAHGLLGLNLKEFTNQREDLSLVHPTVDRRIQESFEYSRDITHLARSLDTLFLELLSGISQTPSATPIITNLSDFPSLKSLSEKAGYSERHLQRLFTETLGIPYKTYIRLTRVNLALKKLEAGPLSFTNLAHTLGYYDQPHFIHDFKAVCDETPTGYIERMSDFYNEAFKF
ncbi:MAG: helix-turn-helix transcriptional regulator [Eubacterium sp.]